MKVVVSAVAFSRNEQLVNKLKEYFADAVVNSEGKRFVFEELIEYYSDADAIITGLEKIDEELLGRLPKLRFIAKYGVGLDNIDLDACKRRSIGIGWTGGVNRYSVAEMAMGMMIMLSRNLYTTSNQLKGGIWNKNGGRSLSECTVGIIGLGFIGRQLVQMLGPFTENILVNDVQDISDFIKDTKIKQVSKEELFRFSNIISIHTPLTAETRNMINSDTIAIMKPDVQIINTARGGIVNERDLVHALKTGRIAGAALDVFEEEPPDATFFSGIPNLVMTPHIGGNSQEAVLKMGYSAINHIRNFKLKT